MYSTRLIEAMPILMLSPFLCLFIVKKEDVSLESKGRFCVMSLIMGLHKLESYLGEEWVYTDVFSQSLTPMDIWVTFSVTFLLGLGVIGLILFGETKRLFFIFSCQFVAETHHLFKDKSYPGRWSVLLMIILNIFLFAPSFLNKNEFKIMLILQIAVLQFFVFQ